MEMNILLKSDTSVDEVSAVIAGLVAYRDCKFRYRKAERAEDLIKVGGEESPEPQSAYLAVEEPDLTEEAQAGTAKEAPTEPVKRKRRTQAEMEAARTAPAAPLAEPVDLDAMEKEIAAEVAAKQGEKPADDTAYTYEDLRLAWRACADRIGFDEAADILKKAGYSKARAVPDDKRGEVIRLFKGEA
jgi:hypothetical protein